MQSGSSDPVNLGNPAELTVLEFARKIIAATGSRSKICYRPLPEDDPRQTASRYQRGPATCWAGNRGWSWGRGLSKLLTIFGAGLGGEAGGFILGGIFTHFA